MRLLFNKRGAWVLTFQDIKNGIDVQGLKSAGFGESADLVADKESVVVEPDISFDGDGAYAEGAVEGNVSPVFATISKLSSNSGEEATHSHYENVYLSTNYT